MPLKITPAVFLDRDGVICENRADYVRSWAEFAFLPGVLAALCRLASTGWPSIVISNQSAVGRGLVSLDTVNAINENMLAHIRKSGGHIDAIYVCPHHPDEGCVCRKPQPGLLLQAAADYGLDLSRSCLIGDAESDMGAALEVGVLPLLVLTGRGPEHLERVRVLALHGKVHVADNLMQAVEWITSAGS